MGRGRGQGMEWGEEGGCSEYSGKNILKHTVPIG